jgi:hypothetical protein
MSSMTTFWLKRWFALVSMLRTPDFGVMGRTKLREIWLRLHALDHRARRI